MDIFLYYTKYLITINSAKLMQNIEKEVHGFTIFLVNALTLMTEFLVIVGLGVLMFYVPRRSNTLNVGKWTEPYSFNRLPTTISGFERLKVLSKERSILLRCFFSS